MKVLLGHNFYRSLAPSGEDVVFHNEQALLEKNGIEVVSYERHNDDIDVSNLQGKVKVAIEGAWSGRTYDELRQLIERHKPIIAHFHNTFPLITPSAWAACQDSGVPVVQTLHNYRFVCPGALLQRGGRPCEACLRKSLLPALSYRCYRESLLATAAQVWMITYNRWKRSFRTLVNRYVALTAFAAGRLEAGGLPGERIEVKPNFLCQSPERGRVREPYAVFVGRLSREKGVETLIETWPKVSGLGLQVLGDGPLRTMLAKRSAQVGLDVKFLGYRKKEDVMDIVSKAALLIIPSECYEGFPMAVLEAYACGTPVVASRIGSLAEIVLDGETGLLFEPLNAWDLAAKVNVLTADRELSSRLGRHAREEFDKKYTAETNYKILMGIYDRAIEDFRKAGKRQ